MSKTSLFWTIVNLTLSPYLNGHSPHVSSGEYVRQHWYTRYNCLANLENFKEKKVTFKKWLLLVLSFKYYLTLFWLIWKLSDVTFGDFFVAAPPCGLLCLLFVTVLNLWQNEVNRNTVKPVYNDPHWGLKIVAVVQRSFK